MHVHDRRSAGDGQRFREVADPHLAVDLRREVRRQVDSFPLDRGEPRERERHGVHAGTQIDDLVLALLVGGDSANLFNQRRTAGFNGHTGHDRTGCIFHDARNGALRLGDGGHQRQPSQRDDDRRPECPQSHVTPSVNSWNLTPIRGDIGHRFSTDT